MKKALKILAVLFAVIATVPAFSFALVLLTLALIVGFFGLILGFLRTQIGKKNTNEDHYQPEKELGI